MVETPTPNIRRLTLEARALGDWLSLLLKRGYEGYGLGCHGDTLKTK